MAKPKAKTGRPLLKIDPEQVAKLAAINCSYEEMAAVLDCDQSTLTKRFSQVIQKGRSQGRMSLKRKQYEMAMQGNVTMLIWLGKQLLGQRDNRDMQVSSPDGKPVDVNIRALSPAALELNKLLEGYVERASGQKPE